MTDFVATVVFGIIEDSTPPPPPPTPGTGEITFDIDRTTLMCAPDSVRFTANLSAAGFAAQGPLSGQFYDARMHDVIYEWDFGYDRTWTIPQNVLEPWRDARKSQGYWVAHMFPEPGTYPVILRTIEPDTNTVLVSDPIDVVITSQDLAYPGNRTKCVNPIGDNDFSDAPNGSDHFNLDVLDQNTPQWAASNSDQLPTRWLFKRGGEFNLAVLMADNENPHLALGSYGAGERPIMHGPNDGTNSGRCISVTPRYLTLNGAVIPDFRVSGLDFLGTFDPTSQLPTTSPSNTSGVFRCDKYMDVMFYDCRMRGMKNSTLGFYMDTNAVPVRKSHSHVDACLITDMGGQYPIFHAPALHPQSSAVMSGTAVVQNPLAADFSAKVRAPIRINHTPWTLIQCCDFFALDRNNSGMKIVNTVQHDGLYAYLLHNSVEGSLRPVSLGGNTVSQGVARPSEHNVIINGLIIVGYYGSQVGVVSYVTGVSADNILSVQPDTTRISGAFVAFWQQQAGSNPAPASVLEKPIRIRGCTAVNLRGYDDTSGANIHGQSPNTNANFVPSFASIPAIFTGFSQSNNIVHGNYAEAIEDYHPLSQNVLFTARTLGYRNEATFELEGERENGPVRSYLPGPSSPALGGAVGSTPYHDITGAVRPANAALGAWQAS